MSPTYHIPLLLSTQQTHISVYFSTLSHVILLTQTNTLHDFTVLSFHSDTYLWYTDVKSHLTQGGDFLKFIHLSDLHLGKRVNGYSMLDDQSYILDQILQIVTAEQSDGVIIAGDVYDKSIPPAEAVELFDTFLVRLAKLSQKVFIISGNHDSPERLSFGGRLMASSGVYVSPVYHGAIAPIYTEDTYGKLAVYLLPFVKPAHIRRHHPESDIESYTDALQVAVNAMEIDPSIRNIAITHQFLTGADRCESEEISIGGTDNVDASVFDVFDYVALGHLHGPQQVTRPNTRYCGTPLKYSFSETHHKKSVTIVELKEKGSVDIRLIPLIPLRDLQEIRGKFSELTAPAFYSGTSLQNDYLHITLIDEDEIPDAIGRLQKIYPYVMKLSYDNRRTQSSSQIIGAESVESKSPLQLFDELYTLQNGQPMQDVQRSFALELIEHIWEGSL